MLYETKFLICLFLTLLIELPIIFILINYIFKSKISVKKILFVGFLASTLTLPYLWFILPQFINSRYYIFIGELFVIVIESVMYNQLLNLNTNKAILLSATANILSFLVGYMIIY